MDSLLEQLFYDNFPIYGIWEDNGIPKNGAAMPLGRSSVTVILTNLFQSYTLEIADNDVLSFMSECGFDNIIWAVDDARVRCEIRSAILGGVK